MLAADVLSQAVPIADGPDWGPIDGPGLGVTVDEAKVMAYHEDFCRHGEYPRTPPLADAR